MSFGNVNEAGSRNRPTPMQYVPRMYTAAIELLFIACAGNDALFLDAKRIIRPEHFRPDLGEQYLRITWVAMLQCKEHTGGFTYDGLMHYAREYHQLNPMERIDTDTWEAISLQNKHGLFFAIVYPDIEINAATVNLARNHMQQFAMERAVIGPLHAATLERTVSDASFTPDAHNKLKELVALSENIKVINELPVINVAPAFGSAVKPAAIFKLTGAAYIDSRIGGQREGDVNAILGATGAGKTTMALDLACCSAKQSCKESRATGQPVAPVIFFSAEESAEKLRPRVWANWFSMQRSFLEGDVLWDSFSRPGNLKQYEIEEQHGQVRMLSEYERYQMYSEDLKVSFRMLDISGSAEFPDAGKGFIPELASYLNRITDTCGVAPYAVYIDYAGLLVARNIDTRGLTSDKAQQYHLARFADQCKQLLAEPNKTTVWALQQLAGTVASWSPTKEITHADTADCKAFVTNMPTCLALGNPDKRTGCRIMHFSKTRYQVEGAPVQKAILKIHPRFARMIDVTNQYSVDPGTRQFVPSAEARSIGGMSLATQGYNDAEV